MKEFIYLDTSFLHSFIAQKDSGLPLTRSVEFHESETTSETKGKSNQIQNNLGVEFNTGQLNVPGVLKSPTAKGDYGLGNNRSTNESITLTQLDAGREIISKQLHDNALQQFEHFLAEHQLLKEVHEGVTLTSGDYIKFRDSFSILDLAYIKNIFDADGVRAALGFAIDTEIKKERERIMNSVNQHNIKQTQAAEREIKRIESQKKKEADEMRSQMATFQVMIDYLVSVLPSSTFLRMGSFICPLKTEYLRENAKEITFKYGFGKEVEITVIGKYTKTLDRFVQISENPETNPLGSVVDVLNSFEEVFGLMGILKKGDKIVSPVAIYFE